MSLFLVLAVLCFLYLLDDLHIIKFDFKFEKMFYYSLTRRLFRKSSISLDSGQPAVEQKLSDFRLKMPVKHKFISLFRLKVFQPEQLLDTPLKRCLSTIDVVFIGIGIMVSAGVYTLTGTVMRNIAGPATIFSYILSGLAASLSAFCYAEFSSRVPKAGSAYVYSYVTVGELPAFIIGWNTLLEYLIGGASVAKAWSAYFDSMLNYTVKDFVTGGNWELDEGTHRSMFAPYFDLIACVLIVVIALFVLSGTRNSVNVNTSFTVVNLCVVAYVVVYGCSFANFKLWIPLAEPGKGFMPYGLTGVLSAASSCFFAYSGFEAICTVAEETKDPTRALPRAIIACMVVASTVYVCMSSILSLMVPFNTINVGSAFADAFIQRGSKFSHYIVSTGALCGMTTALITNVMAAPRLAYAMANDGLLFKELAYVSPVTQVPAVAVISCSLTSLILAITFTLETLVEFLAIGTLMAYTMVTLSVLILRYRITADESESSSVTIAVPNNNHGKVQLSVETEMDGVDGDEEATNKTSVHAPASALENVELEELLPTENSDNNNESIDQSENDNDQMTFRERQRHRQNGRAIAIIMVNTFLILIVCTVMRIRHLIGARLTFLSITFCLLSLLALTRTLAGFKQSTVTPPFRVPLVPYLPVISVFLNVMLIVFLSPLTWVRFSIWLFIGVLLYVFYGYEHSDEGQKAAVLYKQLNNALEHELTD